MCWLVHRGPPRCGSWNANPSMNQSKRICVDWLPASQHTPAFVSMIRLPLRCRRRQPARARLQTVSHLPRSGGRSCAVVLLPLSVLVIVALAAVVQPPPMLLLGVATVLADPDALRCSVGCRVFRGLVRGLALLLLVLLVLLLLLLLLLLLVVVVVVRWAMSLLVLVLPLLLVLLLVVLLVVLAMMPVVVLFVVLVVVLVVVLAMMLVVLFMVLCSWWWWCL